MQLTVLVALRATSASQPDCFSQTLTSPCGVVHFNTPSFKKLRTQVCCFTRVRTYSCSGGSAFLLGPSLQSCSLHAGCLLDWLHPAPSTFEQDFFEKQCLPTHLGRGSWVCLVLSRRFAVLHLSQRELVTSLEPHRAEPHTSRAKFLDVSLPSRKRSSPSFTVTNCTPRAWFLGV